MSVLPAEGTLRNAACSMFISHRFSTHPCYLILHSNTSLSNKVAMVQMLGLQFTLPIRPHLLRGWTFEGYRYEWGFFLYNATKLLDHVYLFIIILCSLWFRVAWLQACINNPLKSVYDCMDFFLQEQFLLSFLPTSENILVQIVFCESTEHIKIWLQWKIQEYPFYQSSSAKQCNPYYLGQTVNRLK